MRDLRARGLPAPATNFRQLRFFLLKNQFVGSLFAGCPLLCLFVYVHVCNENNVQCGAIKSVICRLCLFVYMRISCNSANKVTFCFPQEKQNVYRNLHGAALSQK